EGAPDERQDAELLPPDVPGGRGEEADPVVPNADGRLAADLPQDPAQQQQDEPYATLRQAAERSVGEEVPARWRARDPIGRGGQAGELDDAHWMLADAFRTAATTLSGNGI